MKDKDPRTPLRGALTLRAMLLTAGAAALVAFALRPASRPETGTGPRERFPTRLPPEEISPGEALREASPVSSSTRREVERPRPVKEVTAEAPAQAEPDPSAGSPASRRRDEKKSLPEIFRQRLEDAPAARPSAGSPPAGANAARSGTLVPFGRLIKCQLVETVDSVTARSAPLVALVTEDLCWEGSVIIPAGSEALGYARPEAIIDRDGTGRLIDNGEWTVVLREGESSAGGRELPLRARALDRGEVRAGPGPATWEPADGADGLVGMTVSTQGNREAVLMAAAALSGLAQGAAAVAERQQPAAGLPGVLGAREVAPTLGNAVVSSVGTSATELLGQVAGRIRDEIARRGVYVRVPAGKTFYLYVEQSIDPGAASTGLRLPTNPRPPG